MTLVERIKAECKKKKMSLAALERECGFGNGSIRKWDTSPTSHERLSKVASVLEISVAELTEDPEKEKSPATNEGDKAISSDDLRHLAAFHAADEATKEAIRLLLKKFEQEESQ